MSILRIKHEKSYTVISNRAIRDKKLSFKARGLHHLLLSYPDDWKVNIKHLESESECDGKTAIASALKELEESGYISRERRKDPETKQFYWESIVREQPASIEDDEPQPENRVMEPEAITRFSVSGFSIDGKPDHIISTIPTSTEITNNSPLTPQGEREGEESLPTIDKTKLETNPETFASIPSPHQSARCETELVRDDQISAAPPKKSSNYISPTIRFHQRISGNLHPWQQPNGQPDPEFAEFVGRRFPPGDMPARSKGARHILNNEETEKGIKKNQLDWDDFLEMKNGDFTQGLNTANRKGLETYNHIGRAIASIASVNNSTELTAL
ncbi:phage replication protein [Leptolyngbya boryana NIES-2135]|jgi:hypothetical protein|uniref:Phage replication protein n=1 Tax=Leptolyngbya boryana NIES-2135 TaxID=1973484 RepID=A0A1Z4JPD6_LEPBY|nr:MULTISPECIES: hypothetical protein [Leptolyngbya]BAY58527.1 phage replication protein [Leptolyngbya boryana NIES-2135]MBD2370791.1 hypothetical protein [Leptolyngbya sp. FACHB-161]MBD2377056.1 hypothetical protein [Leptolyngbya sp. FACHB-238]MBD2401499.1 hypothetical protein [Leptolyngbya sp. FACHB-239]MBD2408051.1 hypothetical protein [Leptolyngbya sp. FACHB-402]